MNRSYKIVVLFGVLAMFVACGGSKSLSKKGEKLEIHGSGEQRRDFIHVLDIVKANVAAMNSATVGEIFNIGSGVNYSIKELANFFPIENYHTERRSGDAEETLADISKAQKYLDWNPEISLEQGISQLIEE